VEVTGYLRRLAERATGAGARPAVEPVLRRFDPEPDDPLADAMPPTPPAVPPLAGTPRHREPEADDVRPTVSPGEASLPPPRDVTVPPALPAATPAQTAPEPEPMQPAKKPEPDVEAVEQSAKAPPRRTYLEPPGALAWLAPRPASAFEPMPPQPRDETPGVEASPAHAPSPWPAPETPIPAAKTDRPDAAAPSPVPQRLEPAPPREAHLAPPAPDLHIGRIDITVAEPPAAPKPQPSRRLRPAQATGRIPSRRAAASGLV
jgi:hypothetical protein